MNAPLAHVKQEDDGTWRFHLLDEHLQAVAKRAHANAQKFGCGDWAYLAGMWHDLGKYQRQFQERIRTESAYDPEAHIETSPGKKPHANAGALLALQEETRHEFLGRVIAYLIAGHHTGLPDWYCANNGKRCLEYRLSSAEQELADARAGSPPDGILSPALPELKRLPGGVEGVALWIRLLFSCLVDADFLDTEAFMNPAKGQQRGALPHMPELLRTFNSFMQRMAANAPNTLVNRIRAEVLTDCRSAAAQQSGIYTLTVPTGGGKTLSSLAFALEHAVQHGKDRVIYAIPYTSIIEQTADIFKRVFEPLGECVVEHHSNLDVEPGQENSARRLATENWDAPLIVTTNVQLFESLFAAKTSRCRKLHNLVNAVVVLDEAQLLPPAFLAPILQAMKLLAAHYNVTFVLCTATQPALHTRIDNHGRITFDGLNNAREIVRDPASLYAGLKRVEIHPLGSWDTRWSWAELAGEILKHEAVLVIVNTRQDCRKLYEQIQQHDEIAIHLSALLCGQHRSEVIATIKNRLKARAAGTDARPLRVISTQLVEAGVDLDFPVVFRAAAGLDSIAQAAGRCNREGKLATGHVYVFRTPKPAPAGLLSRGQTTALELLVNGNIKDILAPESYTQYFDAYYHQVNLDEKNIVKRQKSSAGQFEIPFRTIAADFRLIEDEGTSILVPFIPINEATSPVEQWLTLLEQDPVRHKWVYRKLQRYTVNIPQGQATTLQHNSLLVERCGLWVASPKAYSPTLGLLLEAPPYTPEELVL